MKIYQSRSFANKVKKLSKPEKSTLDKEIKKILSDPAIGTEKKGDLRGIFVHKFTESSLELIMLGLHENYYCDLKKYLK